MPTVPSTISLETVEDGSTIVASEHRNNYSAIQTAVNALVAVLADVSTKGDLLVASADDVIARLGVGTNGQVLTANSSAGSGVEWATPSSQAVPPGALTMYGASSAPSGWLLCDGSAVSRATYSALFTAISTTYGVGDGSTTFNVPDMRGRVPVGVSPSGKALVDALGDNDGRSQANRSISHRHTFGSDNVTGFSQYMSRQAQFATVQSTTTGDTDNTDYPAFLVVQYIIKT